jgi:hypothetical protein
MHQRLVLVAAFTLGMIGFAQAQQVDERQAQAACQDDAFRLCNATIPDRDRTLACLIQNKVNLSGGCRTVLADFFPPEPAARKKKAVTQQRQQQQQQQPRQRGGPIDLSPTASR